MDTTQEGTLSRANVKHFWQQESTALAALLETLESREGWTLDREGEIVDKSLTDLGDVMALLTPDSIESLELAEWSDLLSVLSFGRAMRLQRILGDTKPEWMVDFSSFIEGYMDEPDANVNYSRLRLLSQFLFLGSVFQPARLDMISDALYEVLLDED